MMTAHQKVITVNRESLIKVLEANQEEHRKEFAEALVAYKEKILVDLNKALNAMHDASTEEQIRKIRIGFSAPTNYEQEYVEAIDMLKFSVQETIELDQTTFKAYVKNEWVWTAPFKALNASYMSH